MSPQLSAAIFAARELAWQPHVNLSNRKRYAERLEAHQRLLDALAKVTGLSANAGDTLRCLYEAMHRLAMCSFSNRRGAPYAQRRQAMAEIRGCLLAYDREREAKVA